MLRKHVDYYNHDNLARSYDTDVQRTDDLIREGYDRVLDWVIANTGITVSSTVLELGSWTGNLTKRIESCGRIVCRHID